MKINVILALSICFLASVYGWGSLTSYQGRELMNPIHKTGYFGYLPLIPFSMNSFIYKVNNRIKAQIYDISITDLHASNVELVDYGFGNNSTYYEGTELIGTVKFRYNCSHHFFFTSSGTGTAVIKSSSFKMEDSMTIGHNSVVHNPAFKATWLPFEQFEFSGGKFCIPTVQDVLENEGYFVADQVLEAKIPKYIKEFYQMAEGNYEVRFQLPNGIWATLQNYPVGMDVIEDHQFLVMSTSGGIVVGDKTYSPVAERNDPALNIPGADIYQVQTDEYMQAVLQASIDSKLPEWTIKNSDVPSGSPIDLTVGSWKSIITQIGDFLPATEHLEVKCTLNIEKKVTLHTTNGLSQFIFPTLCVMSSTSRSKNIAFFEFATTVLSKPVLVEGNVTMPLTSMTASDLKADCKFNGCSVSISDATNAINVFLSAYVATNPDFFKINTPVKGLLDPQIVVGEGYYAFAGELDFGQAEIQKLEYKFMDN